jgi:hypothetical protein
MCPRRADCNCAQYVKMCRAQGGPRRLKECRMFCRTITGVLSSAQFKLQLVAKSLKTSNSPPTSLVPIPSPIVILRTSLPVRARLFLNRTAPEYTYQASRLPIILLIAQLSRLEEQLNNISPASFSRPRVLTTYESALLMHTTFGVASGVHQLGLRASDETKDVR